MKKLFTVALVLNLGYFSLAQGPPLWMRYPAISPDGKQIVFSYKGDLYKVNHSGGTAVPLTLHEGHDFMPVWSHDGSMIAFASDRYGNFDVFVMPSEGGTAKRITCHSSHDYPSDFNVPNDRVIFTSSRLDLNTHVQFPTGTLPELYSAPVSGGKINMITTSPAHSARYSSKGSKIIYHDRKGYENQWRKHHKSSITRDIWVFDLTSNTYRQVTDWEGEDRNPILAEDDRTIYFLSERSGSFNVHKAPVDNPKNVEQITHFDKHPVRFLTISDAGVLCFSYDGRIFSKAPGQEAKEVDIRIHTDERTNLVNITPANSRMSEMALSPNGKEIAFVIRGEIYVSSVEDGVTKRITNTPGQERSVSFSPDGRSLLYAAERDDNWDVYQSSISRKEEKYFYASTVLSEEKVVATTVEEFQPSYSPDGKEVAYLEERTILKVINLKTKATRVVMGEEHNYSYADGDQYYDWSPDGKWFLVQFLQPNSWIDEVGLVSAAGNGEVINLTQSGYGDWRPKWMNEGKMMIWFSDRDGQKNHGSWGGEADVYGMFFTQKEYDKFKLSKADYALLEGEKKKTDGEEENGSDKENNKKEEKKEKKDIQPVEIELPGIEDRKAKFTIHSSNLSDAILSPKGDKLFYLSNFEKGFDIWQTDLRTKETKILVKLGEYARNMVMGEDGKNIFVLSNGNIVKIETKSGKKKSVKVSGEMLHDGAGERAYIFDHAWRQVLKKFYVTDLHGVDWHFYKKEYAKFLPHINNNHDFSEMLSEMLGELNASHTGCYYRPRRKNKDETASLGLFFDHSYAGYGLRVAEVIEKGPLDKASSKVTEGVIIERIDGVELKSDDNYFGLLNRKKDKNTLLSLYNPQTRQRWEEVVKPISGRDQNELLYRRWVKNQRKMVDELSGGRLGYVHVRGMNDRSYRTVVEDVLGKNTQKEAIVVDTRFNGGGWLHEDLATFLGGEKYMEFAPRNQRLGHEPSRKWYKPSVVIVGESNYSDAHLFPYAYRSKKIGKIVGMPIPGTGTAVWWESQIDPTLVFGIPQVGMLTPDGKYLENNQLYPNVMVRNEPGKLIRGEDQQLAKAVDMLIQEQNKLTEEINLEMKGGANK